jgi:hypothetical protein
LEADHGQRRIRAEQPGQGEQAQQEWQRRQDWERTSRDWMNERVPRIEQEMAQEAARAEEARRVEEAQRAEEAKARRAAGQVARRAESSQALAQRIEEARQAPEGLLASARWVQERPAWLEAHQLVRALADVLPEPYTQLSARLQALDDEAWAEEDATLTTFMEVAGTRASAVIALANALSVADRLTGLGQRQERSLLLSVVEGFIRTGRVSGVGTNDLERWVDTLREGRRKDMSTPHVRLLRRAIRVLDADSRQRGSRPEQPGPGEHDREDWQSWQDRETAVQAWMDRRVQQIERELAQAAARADDARQAELGLGADLWLQERPDWLNTDHQVVRALADALPPSHQEIMAGLRALDGHEGANTAGEGDPAVTRFMEFAGTLTGSVMAIDNARRVADLLSGPGTFKHDRAYLLRVTQNYIQNGHIGTEGAEYLQGWLSALREGRRRDVGVNPALRLLRRAILLFDANSRQRLSRAEEPGQGEQARRDWERRRENEAAVRRWMDAHVERFEQDLEAERLWQRDQAKATGQGGARRRR